MYGIINSIFIELIFFIYRKGGVRMPFCYDKLWNIAYNNHLNKTSLRDKAGITNATLARIYKNQTVSMEALARICNCLDVGIEEIVEYQKEGKKYEKR